MVSEPGHLISTYASLRKKTVSVHLEDKDLRTERTRSGALVLAPGYLNKVIFPVVLDPAECHYVTGQTGPDRGKAALGANHAVVPIRRSCGIDP